MKTIVTICFTFLISCFCYSQDEWTIISDSLGLESRIKADIVLSKLDISFEKLLLFSLQNRDYLIIIKRDSCYNEYVIKVDSGCNVLTIREIDNNKIIKELTANNKLSRSNRRLLKRLLEDRQTVKDAFDTSQYSTEFTTSMPNASWVAGVPSYFVIKDERNKRYGEYCLSSITVPCPIKPSLWGFLIRELSDKKNL